MGKKWQKEMETADKELSKRKVSGRKDMEKEIMMNSPPTTVTPRK